MSETTEKKQSIFNSDLLSRRSVTILIFLIAFAICFAAGFLYCFAKRTFEVDESLTFALANESRTGWVTYQPEGWFLPSFFSGYRVSVPFDYRQVLANQAADVHPPLYYLLIHTVSSFFPGTFSVWYGLGINLFLFLLNGVLIYGIVKKYTGNPLAAASGMILYCMNFRMLEGLAFIRMYQMASTFVLLFFLQGWKIVEREGGLEKSDFLFLSLIVLIGGLTHYFFYFGILSCCIFFAVVLIVKRRWAALLSGMVCVAGVMLLNILILFPATLDHLFSGESIGVHGRFVIDHLIHFHVDKKRLLYFISHSWGGSSGFWLGAVLLISGMIMLMVKRSGRYLPGVLALASYYVYFLVVSQTATYLYPRYILPMEVVGMTGAVLVLVELMEIMKMRDIAFLPVVLMIVMESDFYKMKMNLQSVPSWEYAAANSDKVCLVLSDGSLPDYCINTSFPDFACYRAVGITTFEDDLPEMPEGNFIFYAKKGMDYKNTLAFTDRLLSGRDFELREANVIASQFVVYEVNIYE